MWPKYGHLWFFLLGGSEFWNFVGPKMNSCDQILINFPKKSCLPQELLWFILAAPKNSKRKAWLKPSQSCWHQSYPKSAQSLFGHPDYITDQKPETECVNLDVTLLTVVESWCKSSYHNFGRNYMTREHWHFFSSETFIIEKHIRCLFHSWTSTCSWQISSTGNLSQS